MTKFEPDFNNLLNAAKNLEPGRILLYDHNIDAPFLTKALGVDMMSLATSNKTSDLRSFFELFCKFLKDSGYDTVSFEVCIGPLMPDSGSPGGHKPGVIRNRKDVDHYPWQSKLPVPGSVMEN